MKKIIEIKKKLVNDWFQSLQKKIIYQFQIVENEMSKKNKKKPRYFIKREWKKNNKKEGGGTSYLLSEGEIFDKVGVNQSTVSGQFEKAFRSKVLGAEKNGKYWATGISVVAHMKNPKIPALHFNTRFIVTSKEWFGGGVDMTPCFTDKTEEALFHSQLKKTCVKNSKDYYKYKKWCDKYFYIPHRQETRGVGGIFFDYFYNNNWDRDFSFVKDVGKSFLNSYVEIINGRVHKKFNESERKKLLIKRGRYVEFNLLYDRGTIFGLKTGGNTEAVLMSMPPAVIWQ